MGFIWSYRATPQEEGLCAEIGYERQKPYFGRPEMNRNYSMGDLHELGQHGLTALSELAFARMIGMNDFVPTKNTYKSEPDVGVWEVRYTAPEGGARPAMRFSEGVDNLDSPYVLLVGGPDGKTRRTAEDGWLTPPFYALGWMWGRDCVNPDFEAVYSTNPNKRKFLVPQSYLRSMDEITVKI